MRNIILIAVSALFLYCSCDKGDAIPATGLMLDHTSLELSVGQEFKLNASLTPSNSTSKVIWTSSNESVATVESGVITTLSKGSAVIKVAAGSVEATCSLVVRGIPEGAVDLGFTVKRKDGTVYHVYWAKCNLGASSPEDFGDYYAWADPELYYTGYTRGQRYESFDKISFDWKEGKAGFDDESYKWYEVHKVTSGISYVYVKKYNAQPFTGYVVDYRSKLDLNDDAARVKLGGSWRTPTEEEWEGLIKNCSWEWISLNGINGYKVVSKANGNSIFLPASGYMFQSINRRVLNEGFYWAASLYTYENSTQYSENYGSILYFNSNEYYTDALRRENGLIIRPVTE